MIKDWLEWYDFRYEIKEVIFESLSLCNFEIKIISASKLDFDMYEIVYNIIKIWKN